MWGYARHDGAGDHGPTVRRALRRGSGALDRLVGTQEALTAALIVAGPGIGRVPVWLTGVTSAAMLISAGTSLGAAALSRDREVMELSETASDEAVTVLASLVARGGCARLSL